MSGSKGFHSSSKSPFAGTQLFAAPTKTPSIENTPTSTSKEPYFRVVASGPAVDPREIDSQLAALEVTVCWGEHDVLEVAHLAPPRAFVVGERSAEGEAVDFELASAMLGRDRFAVVEPTPIGPSIRVPAGARLRVLDGTNVREHEAMLGALVPVAGELDVTNYVLREGETASVAWKGFVFRVRSVAAAKPVPARRRPDAAPLAFTAGVGAVVAATLGIGTMLMPDRAMLGGDTLQLDDRYVAALIEAREQLTSAAAPSSADDPVAENDATSGDAGDPRSSDRRDPRPRTTAHPGETTSNDHSPPASGPVGAPIVNALSTVVAFFGETNSGYVGTQAGGDSMAVLENLLGGAAVSSSGLGGLGLTGVGVGSHGSTGGYLPGGGLGGPGGPGGPGLIPHREGYGNCRGPECGEISERGPVAVRVPVPTAQVASGSMSAEAIRRVVSRNISQVRHCYEQGLQRDPSLSGRVTVAFVIGPTGAVLSTRAEQGGISDDGVASCVAGSVRRWAFPQPDDGGTVSVRFPFTLSRAAE